MEAVLNETIVIHPDRDSWARDYHHVERTAKRATELPQFIPMSLPGIGDALEGSADAVRQISASLSDLSLSVIDIRDIIGPALAAASSEALARIAEITKALFPAGVQSELTEYRPLDHASAEDLISLAEVNQIISTLERKHDMDSVQMMTRYRSGDLSDNEDYSEWSLLLRARDQHYEQS